MAELLPFMGTRRAATIHKILDFYSSQPLAIRNNPKWTSEIIGKVGSPEVANMSSLKLSLELGIPASTIRAIRRGYSSYKINAGLAQLG